MKRAHGIFHVGLKVLLKRGSEVLLLRADNGGLDLPGGRIDNVEYAKALGKIIAREMREEIGPVKYQLGQPLFHYRRYLKDRDVYVFCAVYEAEYLSGTIRLSSEHTSYAWIDPHTVRLNSKDFRDKEAYRTLKQYFKENYN